MFPTRLSYKSAARATASTTARRLQLASSTGKSSGPCYLSKMNNKLWWLRNTGITSSDPEWSFSRLICHFSISDMRPFTGIGDQSSAVSPVWTEVTPPRHAGRCRCRAGRVSGSQPCWLPLHCLSPGFPLGSGCSNTNQTPFPPTVSFCLLHAELTQQLPRTAVPGFV